MVSTQDHQDAVFSGVGVGFWPHDEHFYSESRNVGKNSTAILSRVIRQVVLRQRPCSQRAGQGGIGPAVAAPRRPRSRSVSDHVEPAAMDRREGQFWTVVVYLQTWRDIMSNGTAMHSEDFGDGDAVDCSASCGLLPSSWSACPPRAGADITLGTEIPPEVRRAPMPERQNRFYGTAFPLSNVLLAGTMVQDRDQGAGLIANA
jgi:hypothetical protein